MCGGPIHRQGHQQDRKGRCSVRPSYHPARHSVLRRHRRQLARRTRMRRHARASTPRQEWIQHPYSVRAAGALRAPRGGQAAHSRPGRGGMGQVAERNAGAARAAAQVAYLPPHTASEAGVGGSTADLCSRRQIRSLPIFSILYLILSPPIDLPNGEFFTTLITGTLRLTNIGTHKYTALEKKMQLLNKIHM